MQCLGKHGDWGQVTLRLQRMEEVIVWRGISHHRSCDLESFTIDIGIMPSNKMICVWLTRELCFREAYHHCEIIFSSLDSSKNLL